MDKKITIIFDFDGTLVQTMDAVKNIVNQLAGEYGFRQAADEEIPGFREKTLPEIIKILKIPLIKIPSLVKRVRQNLAAEIESIKPAEGIAEVLLGLKRDNYSLGLLTSDSEENVKRFLTKNNLMVFDFFYSSVGFFGKTKVIKNLLKARKLAPKDVVYVGDEIRDIEASHKAGIAVVAVGWGYNTESVLRAKNPDYFAATSAELANILRNIRN